MEQNGAPAAGQQPISDEMQFMGDLMILQVLADSEQVNDQEREVLHRWIEKAQLPAAAACAEQGWQPIETAPKHEEVLVWREDCGTILAIFTYCADQGWLSDKEQDEMDEETLWKEDWWWFGPHGVVRMEGSEVPTHWMPLPPAPGASLPPPARNGEMSNERIDALLSDLDFIAREYEIYEYGLPMRGADEEDGPINKLRDAVRKWSASCAPKQTEGDGK